jgi:hypothetical protein
VFASKFPLPNDVAVVRPWGAQQRTAADVRRRTRQTAASVYAALQALGAPEHCYAIAASADLDGRLLPLREALDKVLGMGDGVVLSCVPGKLAYYESEEANGRYSCCAATRPNKSMQPTWELPPN